MKRLLSTTETVAALFLLGIALLTAGNVLLRNVFNLQIPDWFDGAKLLQGIALFWGFAVATYYGTHICVDIVWEHLHPEGRRWLDIVASLVTAAFLGFMAWMVWIKVGSTGTQTTSDLQWPLRYFYALAACGVCAAFVLAGLRVVRLVRRTPISAPAEGGQHGS
jgi:TRAP-type C4-dicarboxylate transport system permease small subunit